MNDLRRLLLWLSILVCLGVGVWGLQWDERSEARPFAPEYREFRLTNRVVVLGHPFYIPLSRMIYGWGAVLCAVAGLWPLATPERSSRWLGSWERRAAPKGEARRGPR